MKTSRRNFIVTGLGLVASGVGLYTAAHYLSLPEETVYDLLLKGSYKEFREKLEDTAGTPDRSTFYELKRTHRFSNDEQFVSFIESFKGYRPFIKTSIEEEQYLSAGVAACLEGLDYKKALMLIEKGGFEIPQFGFFLERVLKKLEKENSLHPEFETIMMKEWMLRMRYHLRAVNEMRPGDVYSVYKHHTKEEIFEFSRALYEDYLEQYLGQDGRDPYLENLLYRED